MSSDPGQDDCRVVTEAVTEHRSSHGIHANLVMGDRVHCRSDADPPIPDDSAIAMDPGGESAAQYWCVGSASIRRPYCFTHVFSGCSSRCRELGLDRGQRQEAD
jgi:hypothetical protein